MGRRKRDTGEGGYRKKKDTAMRNREETLEKMPERLKRWTGDEGRREVDRQKEISIKSLDQSREETDETV